MCCPSYIEKIIDRQRPYNLTESVACNNGGRVRFLHIAAELGKDLVVADTHRSGYAQFKFDSLTQFICNGFSVTEQMRTAGYIQPAFIETVRFYLIGVLTVNLSCDLRVFHIQIVVRRYKYNVRTFLLCHPQWISRSNAAGFSSVVFGKHDSVSGFGIAGNCNRLSPKRGII